MKQLVLLRPGESTWNKENRFTGWTDVPLSGKGIEDAGEAGRLLREAGLTCDITKRAIKTLWIVLEEMDLMWIPVVGSWQPTGGWRSTGTWPSSTSPCAGRERKRPTKRRHSSQSKTKTDCTTEERRHRVKTILI
jgi:bisphosphoglycerate-dependent phosphoglycerate mutase